jgi:8-oxo-dGTP pyrophosphatase MutT (NUDIX family)
VEPNAAQYVVAACVIVRRGDRVLAMRRSKDKDAGPGLWETISGRVEVGEEPLAAAHREVAEETGLSVRIEPRPVTAYAATRLGVPMVVIVYEAGFEGGVVRPSIEHDDHAWLTANEFAARSTLSELTRAVRAVLGS